MVHAVLPVPRGGTGQEFEKPVVKGMVRSSTCIRMILNSTCMFQWHSTSKWRFTIKKINCFQCSPHEKARTSGSSLYQCTSSILSWKMVHAVLRVWLEMIDTDGKQKKETDWKLQEASIKVLRFGFCFSSIWRLML